MRDLATVVEGVAATRARIERACARAGRATHEVELLAAVKYLSLEELPLLAEAGVPLVGENRTDQLAAKQAATGDRFTWDFIGHLQSRKARDVVGRVRLVHAVESDSLAAAIDRAASAPQPVLVQVNTARDPGKYGVLPEEVDAFLERLAALPGLEVRGLMTMPALADDDPASSRGAFAALRELAGRCAGRWEGAHRFDVLSMGTSQDFEVAIEEGATIVRLGGVLYGRERT